MIRDRGSNYTAVFDSVLADAGIPDRALQGPDAPHERHRRTLDPGDAAASSWTAPSSGTRLICGGSCASTRPTTISTGGTGRWTPLRR